MIRQAENAGISKIVYTSTMATVINPSGELDARGSSIKTIDHTGPVYTSDGLYPPQNWVI